MEWTEDELQSAESNKHVEGADAGADTSAPVVERGNYCQIMSRVAEITGTLETVDKYGRDLCVGIGSAHFGSRAA